MLSKILSTATLIVVAWMSLQLVQTQRALGTVQANVQQSLMGVRAEINDVAENNESVGADVLQRIEELAESQVKLAKSTNKADPKLLKAKDQKITLLNQTASLQEVVVKVLRAELLAKDKQGAEAAKVLLSTKSSIWKLSEKWGKSKDALRGLMAPIDVLAGMWKRGDYAGNTKAIQKVIQEVLAAQVKS